VKTTKKNCLEGHLVDGLNSANYKPMRVLLGTNRRRIVEMSDCQNDSHHRWINCRHFWGI